MAIYKYSSFIEKYQGEEKSFDLVYKPGVTPPHSGVYRCQGCGREIVAEESRKFPPQNHHEHSTDQGEIRWRLTVYADHEPK